MSRAEGLDQLRDSLASHFSAEMLAALPGVRERLANMLAAEQVRERWRPLREANLFLGSVESTLGLSLAKKVAERFDAKAHPEKDTLSKTQRFSLGSLSLVADDDMQQEIAIGNTAKALHEQLKRDLAPLTSLLEELLEVRHLADENNPAYPRIFCRALFEALEEVGADGVIRMDIYRACEPEMARIIRAVYAALSDGRKVKESAPETPRFLKPANFGKAAETPARAASGPAPSGSALSRPDATAASVPPAQTPTAAPGMVTVQIRADLLEALLKLQSQMDSPASPPGQPLPTAQAPRESVAEAIVRDVFERLCADARIRRDVRTQLARLQAPVMRVARDDPALLANPSDPVTRLLDLACAFGLGGGAESDDAPLASSTDALLASPQDRAAFAQALESLEAAFARRQDAVTRLHPLMAGEHAAMGLEAAADAAEKEVKERIAADPRATTPEAARFGERAWTAVLAHDLRKFGRGSPQWQEDLATFDFLLWSLGPKAPGELRQMLAQLPALVLRLREGFSRAQLDTATVESLLEEMKRMHTQVLREHLPVQRRAAPTLAASTVTPSPVPLGAWIELREGSATRRYRVNALRAFHGDCLLRDLVNDRWLPLRHAVLARGLLAKTAWLVPGPGIAIEAIEAAMQDARARRGHA